MTVTVCALLGALTVYVPPGAAAPTVPLTKSCKNGATTLAAGDVTFGDEPSVAAPYAGYARTVRIHDCAAAPGTGITTAGMRQVTVTISYRPLTAAGVASSGKSVTLTMLVAQR